MSGSLIIIGRDNEPVAVSQRLFLNWGNAIWRRVSKLFIYWKVKEKSVRGNVWDRVLKDALVTMRNKETLLDTYCPEVQYMHGLHNSQLNRVTFAQVWRPEEEEPFFRIEVNNKRAYDSFCGGKPRGGESFASTRPIPRKSSMTQLQLPYHTLPNLTREAGGSLCIYTWDWGRRLAWLIAN